ncbi:MAG: hypothetical protein IJY16_02210, partial [Clostridia bacterium]|nr:hypothetical protein [Clostridia bacterium]
HKEKSYQKRNAENVSPSAEGEEGSAPSTAPPFEKGGRKLPTRVCANRAINQNLNPSSFPKRSRQILLRLA